MEARTDHPSAWRASAGSWLARPAPASALLILAVALVLAGQELLRPPARPVAALGAYALGLVLIVVLERLAPRPLAPAADAAPGQATAGRGQLGQRALLGAVVVGAATIWALMRTREVADSYTDVVVIWIATLAVAVLASAAGSWPPRGQRVRAALTRDRPTVGLAVLLFLVAFLLRGIALDGFPYVFGGDEGSEAMWAVNVLAGRWTDPFGTGWYNLPTLWFFLQAASMRLFGESVAGVRMITAVVGALTVLFTYLLARRLYGPVVGLSAAALLAAFHYHVFFSRVASLQVVDTLAIVAALYWLDRGFEGTRPTACLLAGYAVGFAQYGSFAGRLVPLVAVAYVVATIVRTVVTRGVRAVAPAAWARQLRLVGWVVLGAALAVLPLYIHYVNHPNEFNRRVNEVSIFASGWLANEQAASGQSAAELILRQVARAALLPVATEPDGWYHPASPLVGWPLAGLIVIGLALVSIHAFRREYVALAAAYWGAVLGVGLTDVPGATQRFVIVAPLLAIFAAIGLDGLLRIARVPGGVRPALVRALGVCVVGGVVAWNLLYYFQLPDDNRLYGDDNSLIATRVGHLIRTDHPGSVVYFFGGPRMLARGFESLGFIAHGAPVFDVEEPWASRALAPTAPVPKVFVFLPHRLAELAQIREWFPAGEGREFHGPTGSLLFYVYAAP